MIGRLIKFDQSNVKMSQLLLKNMQDKKATLLATTQKLKLLKIKLKDSAMHAISAKKKKNK